MNRPELEVNYSPLTIAEVKNKWRCNFAPPLRGENFTICCTWRNISLEQLTFMNIDTIRLRCLHCYNFINVVFADIEGGKEAEGV